MKRLMMILVMVVMLPGCNWFSCCDHCTESGAAENMIHQDRDVQGFHEVAVSGCGTLELSYADKEGVVVEANSHTINKVQAEVHDGVLHLYTRGGTCCAQDAPVTYRVAAKSIDKVSLSGSVALQAPKLEAKDIVIEASGTCSVNAHVVADNCTVRGSGSSQYKLTGKVHNQRIEFMGTGVYEALDLECKESDIAAMGSVRVSVNATDKLAVEAHDETVVEYKGSPALGIRSSGASIKNIQA